MDDDEPAPSENDSSQIGVYPTTEEVFNHFLSTLRHSMSVHYFAKELRYEGKDPEFPHDIVGSGNKYEWDVVRGMALQYREPVKPFEAQILASVELHRQQYHHKMWNGNTPNPDASRDDMILGAIDTACALMENRPHNPFVCGYDSLQDVFDKLPKHKAGYGRIIIPEMRKLALPKVSLITRLDEFPNIGVSKQMYNKILERTREAIVQIEREHRYRLSSLVERK